MDFLDLNKDFTIENDPSEYYQYINNIPHAIEPESINIDEKMELEIPLNGEKSMQQPQNDAANGGSVRTIFMKTPRKLKKVPFKFSTVLPNVGKTEIVYRPDIFDKNQFYPRFPLHIRYTKNKLSTDTLFKQMCEDYTCCLCPKEMKFALTEFWPEGNFSFGSLVGDFFQRKNNPNCRFYHKLYNALQISKHSESLVFAVGVEWLNETVIKVYPKEFARLLGINSIEGSLFHQQGNFPSHGFIELTKYDILEHCTPEEAKKIDFDETMAFIHKSGDFTRSSNEEDIAKCNWSKCVPKF